MSYPGEADTAPRCHRPGSLHAAVVGFPEILTEARTTQTQRATLLLAHEGAAGSAAECAAAAGRVYDKLHAHLRPLLGSAGVQALLGRSAKLTQRQFHFLEAPIVESSTTLSESLRVQDPAVAMGAAAALFGTFFELMTTFIGERLTTQALRRAWPTIEDIAPSNPRRPNK